MKLSIKLIYLLFSLTPLSLYSNTAGEDLINRWFAFDWSDASSKTLDPFINLYWPDAVLIGTNANSLTTGDKKLRKYFQRLQGKKITKGKLTKTVLTPDKNTKILLGFYEFRIDDSSSILARYTMVVTKRDNNWRILHHHNSMYRP